jgi:dGTPase
MSLEKLVLKPYASFSVNSKGRQYAADEHPYRSAYMRDRDRIIHSKAFRRLEYKTQVFINHEGDHFRTRLTHSLEVSQIARTIAHALGLNTDLTEAIGLAHDLGHTPFGHTGEKTLNDLMAEHGGFEHNRQSLRIVEYLEEKYPQFSGLNLTFETREGIIKHTSFFDNPNHEQFARFLPDKLPTLEAQIIDRADEIAYINHDLDDGLRSGYIVVEDLRASVPLFEALWVGVDSDFPSLNEEGKVAEMVRRLINLLVSDIVKTSIDRIEKSGVKTVEDVREAATRLIEFSAEIDSKRLALKDFLLYNLYRHQHVERMRVKTSRFLKNIFREYLDQPVLMPAKVRQKIDQDGLHLVVCDYVAGMTDRFAIEEYRRLFDPSDLGLTYP